MAVVSATGLSVLWNTFSSLRLFSCCFVCSLCSV